MKRLMLGLLVGFTALAPVLAQAQQRERGHLEDLDRVPDRPRQNREQRREAREERRVERQAEGRTEPVTPTIDRPRRDRDGDGVRDPSRERRFDRERAPSVRPDGEFPRRAGQLFPPARQQRLKTREDGRESLRERPENRREFREFRRDDRLDRREDRREWRADRRNARQDWRNDRPDYRQDRRDWRDGDDGWSSWGRQAYGGGLVWSRGWRGDRRYDWARHRDLNRGIYRLPRYYAPYDQAHAYRRFGLGSTLSRSLYAQGYSIDDPWLYRLPPVYGPYRWVRYYDDALLVDLRTGRVVDTIYGIFH